MREPETNFEMRAPEMRAPEMRAPEMRAPGMRTPETAQKTGNAEKYALVKEILEQLSKVNSDDAYLKNVLDAMEKIPADGDREIIEHKITSLEAIVTCRETTIQKMAAAYTQALEVLSRTE